MSRERQLPSRAVEMNAHLALDDDIKLGAGVTLAEDRLAFDVMTRDHQTVDRGQLVERERAEERHLLQRDQLFHLLIESVDCGFGGLANPLVRMGGQGLELRV